MTINYLGIGSRSANHWVGTSPKAESFEGVLFLTALALSSQGGDVPMCNKYTFST